jgi:hypothetical protein
MAAMVELRCPEGMGKLLAKTRVDGPGATTTAAGLVEVACNNCARAHRARGVFVVHVLHRFNLLGELVDTEIVPG